MSNDIPTYDFVKSEVFEKINREETESLFFCSLFDSSSWEETTRERFLDDFLKCKQEALSIIRQNGALNKELSKNEDQFCAEFVESERLTNYLLSYLIEKNSDGKISADGKKLSKSIKEFPDITLNREDKTPIYIEVKRLISADDLQNRIQDEVIGAINRNKSKYSNLLLLLLFPVLFGEKADRIYQLIKGYYIYEKIVCNEAGIVCKVLCRCHKPSDNEHNLLSLTSKILSNDIIKI